MSRLDELIAELCPDGVAFYNLAEIFEQFSGMGGVANKWANEGNCRFVDYMNAYSHISIDINNLPYATVKRMDQNTLRQGDILFTSASETPDECAISSVIEDAIMEGIFLDDHLFGLRVKEQYKANVFPSFLKYAFRANSFRAQIKKAVRGVTRFYVSKPDFMKLTIPVPPLPVQQEIVRILDHFTELTAELQEQLTVELTARKKQYEYYSKKLIEKSVSRNQYTSIGDLGNWQGGKTPSMNNKCFWENGSIPWISSKDMKSPVLRDTEDHITESALSEASMRLLPAGSVAIVTRSGILKHTFPVAYVPFRTTINQDIKALVPYTGVSGRYVSLAMQAFSDDIRNKTKKQGGTVDSLDFNGVLNYKIPMPDYNTQLLLVQVLEKYDTLCNDLSSGLPAEIAARQKQYEYYRDKLLTFKEKKVQ